jgi:hypothetical protein
MRWRPTAERDDLVLERERDCLQLGVDAQLNQQVLDVCADEISSKSVDEPLA